MYINDPGHMTKMAAMPIYGNKKRYDTSVILIASIFYRSQ